MPNPYRVSGVEHDGNTYGGKVIALDEDVSAHVRWHMEIRTSDPAITEAVAVGAVVTIGIEPPAEKE